MPGSISMLYYQSWQLYHALVNDTDYFGWISINSQGMRGPEVSSEKQEGTTRLMVVGASTTFDTQVSGDDRTWPARLGYWLTELAPNQQVEIINAGVPGYGVINNVIRLQTELHRLSPDVVLLYQAHNDISCLLRDDRLPGRETKRPDEIPTDTPWRRWLQHNSLLYNKLKARFLWLGVLGQRPSDSADQSDDAPRKCGPEQFERDLSLFIAAAKSLGIRPVLAEVVHVSGVGTLAETDSAIRARWSRVRPYAEPDSGLVLYARYAEIARQVAERHAVPFIPTQSFGLEGEALYSPADPMHFNDAGADLMGRAMAEALLASGVID